MAGGCLAIYCNAYVCHKSSTGSTKQVVVDNGDVRGRANVAMLESPPLCEPSHAAAYTTLVATDKGSIRRKQPG